ncbi:MAG: hypothetical protein LUQ21_02525 [Methanothrix sp.]|nr:hypothetical protein [Methanothrix sp.]
MEISIPLFSTPLLISAALIGLGFLAYLYSARAGVVLMGAGGMIMGGVVILDLPQGDFDCSDKKSFISAVTNA